ncbi:MAG: NADH-quinone oxidoreductase subunit NuoK [Pseudomonadota bacterium]
MIGQDHYLILSAALFAVAAFGAVNNRTSALSVLICLELMLLAAAINVVSASALSGVPAGQGAVVALWLLGLGKLAVGLAIVVCFFRNRASISLDDATIMKG